MLRRISLILVAALALFGTVQTSQAVLSAVDPGPYNAKYGFFPIWYQDATAPGVPPAAPPSSGVLELCISQTVGPNGPMCTLLPPPSGPGFDPALPVIFPFNFPDEVFWFAADTTIVNAAAGIDLLYVAALEAAFGGGAVVNGDQISFARIRIRVDVPAPGSYTITHPYGTKTYDVPVPPPGTPFDGRRGINDTVDVGIGAPGSFAGALGGAIGPFLTASTGLITIPATGEVFIGDPNITQTVVGGPFGNTVRITGPGGIDLQTDQFTLMGKLFDGALPTALAVDRSTYSRTATASQIDVFATSTATATLTYRDTLALPVPPATGLLMTGDGTGKFYGQESNPTAIPAHVIVTAADPTAVPATTPTPLASPVVDVVKITKAIYSLGTKNLVVEANSSDQVAVPILTAIGFGDLSVVVPGPKQQLIASPVAEPPARITVKSSNGGSDTEPVVIVPSFNLSPVAVNDSATTPQGVAVNINVLGNDSDPDGNTPLTVANLTQPANGTAAVQANNTVTYTPNAGFAGTNTFTYQARDSLLALSNVATVTVTVSAPNQAPVAVNDAATTPQGVAVNINVLGNDSDPDGNIPLTVANVTQPANGTAAVQANNTVTYTPNAGFAGTNTFTYQARDSLLALSNVATVTVSVTNAPPVAVNDAATTPQGVAVNINVLGNDSDPDGNTPLTVANLTQPANGTAAVQANNTVTYTPNAGFAGTNTFTYQARDSLLALSNVATVTVTVNAIAETVTIQKAQYTVRKNQWDINGNTTARVAGETMTLFLIRGGVVVGTIASNVPVARNGKWDFRGASATVPPPVPANGDIVRALSSLNNSAQRALQVK
jgi:hypothetical protein